MSEEVVRMKQGHDLISNMHDLACMTLHSPTALWSLLLEQPTRWDQMCHLMAKSKRAQYTHSCTRVAEKERLIFSLLLAA
jgi:hypothetical protein